jgi:hypothetical protein
VIGFDWEGTTPATPAAFSIDHQKLNDLLAQPGNTALTLLLSKVQNLDDLKALQILILMLISSPEELLALEYRQQGFLGLPLGRVAGIDSNELIQLIQEEAT